MKINFKISTQTKAVIAIYALLLIIFIVMMIISPSYRSIRNIGNIIVQSIPLSIVSLGQTIVMVSGGIDMSVGAMISLTTCIAATSMATGTTQGLVVGLALIFIVAFTVGTLNGVGVNYLKVPPMITTLSTMIILDGVSQAILPVAGGKVHIGFARFMTARFGLISIALVVLILVFILLRHILYNTKFGVSVYGIGNNRRIAESMGVNTKRISTSVYIIASLCASIAGILLATRMRIGDPLVGAKFGLDSITAAAIGGTALTGGIGLVSGSIAGAFLIGMLSNMMNILGVNHFYQYVLKGLLLVIAMIAYSIINRLAVKRNEKN